jgi:hypothetical protein
LSTARRSQSAHSAGVSRMNRTGFVGERIM